MTNPKHKSHSTPHRPSQGGIDFRNRVKRDKQKPAAATPKATAPVRSGNPMGRPCIILRADRDKSLLRRHPWIFSGAVECIDGKPASGDTVAVRDASGSFLAWAAYNPDSQIIARVWSWNEKDVVDKAFFRTRIASALAARRTLGLEHDSNGMRLIHGESDGLPGLIVDQYGNVLVMQLGSAGPEHWRETFADILQELCSPVCIYERSDSDGRELEGLPKRCGIVRGTLPDKVEVTEHGILFAVDVAAGQKTGFYLDQRDNRALTGTLAHDKDVLNCFCYTGGFSLYALRGGAKSVLSIDSSQEALQLAQANVELNGLDGSRAEWQCADVFEALRKLRDQNRKFDLIVLDPPKFAPTAAFAEKAARAYKDINLLGFKLLRPGGLLFTYSCSGGISDDLFQKIIAGAALDAGVDAQIVKKLHAAADHPVLLSFPEGAYLKGLVLRVS
jgi:23S rRNA (cytosine1962-C5)-methyltransferase